MRLSTPTGAVAARPERAWAQLSPAARLLAVLLGLVLTGVSLELASLGYLWSLGFGFRRAAMTEVVKDDLPNNLQPDPRRIWSYAPNTRFTFINTREGRSIDVRINGRGFRGRSDAALSKQALKFVALGDSFTFGWLVQEQERWDEVLARLLNQKGVVAAPVNLGVWMSTFDQHALVLQEHLPEEAKLVIHLVYPSHLQTINRHVDEIANGRIVAVHDPLLHVHEGRLLYGAASDALVSKRLFFPFSLCALEYRTNLQSLRRLAASGQALPAMTDEQIYERQSQHLFENGWQLAEQSIRQISDTLAARGIPYVVVLVPRDRQVSAASWRDSQPIREILEGDVPQARFREIVARTGWALCLDLLPAFREQSAAHLYFDTDPHWSPAGHALAAQQILGFLLDHGLPDGSR